MRIKYRRRESTRVSYYNPWDMSAEVGDLMVCAQTGKLYRLQESSGINQARSGELYPRTIKPPQSGMKAILEDGEIYWTDESEV